MTVAYVSSAVNIAHPNCVQAGIATYFGPGDIRNFCGKLGGSQQSSQRADIESIRRAVIRFKDLTPDLSSESTLIVRCKSEQAIEFISSCRAQLSGDLTDGLYIPNDAMDNAVMAAKEIINANFNVQLEHIPTQSHMVGIEMANSKASIIASR
ncbi:hypothetical protein EV183_004405 [Coemansia sp. RSA 2336]|nr:hypothetical protein EV183_004405 [Coemansia sp. RSA 2336]